MSIAIILCLAPLKQGFSLNLELDWHQQGWRAADRHQQGWQAADGHQQGWRAADGHQQGWRAADWQPQQSSLPPHLHSQHWA